MESKFVGSLYVLKTLPIWFTMAILFIIAIGVILIGRQSLEGTAYNPLSSGVGDCMLILVGVGIGAGILQRGKCTVPKLLQNVNVHLMIFTLCFLAGVAICRTTILTRGGQSMDIYHDIVVVPMFLQLAATLLPVIFMNGTKIEKVAVILVISLWIGLVGADTKYRPNARAAIKIATKKW
jgi:hypothetical protein